MRMQIFEEGVPIASGQLIAPGALKLPANQHEVPVTLGGDWTTPPVGKACNLERDGNVLTMDVELFDDSVNLEAFQANLFANHLVQQGVERRVESGLIRAVILWDKG